MDHTVADADEQVRTPPLLWRSRDRIHSLSRTVHPADNAMRNIRVFARRAVTARENHTDFSSELCVPVPGAFEGMRLVGHMLDGEATVRRTPKRGELPFESGDIAIAQLSEGPGKVKFEDVVRYLHCLAARTHSRVIEDVALSEQVVSTQSRPSVVNLLQVCGLSGRSAVATLPPTMSSPAMPSEVWNEQPVRRGRVATR